MDVIWGQEGVGAWNDDDGVLAVRGDGDLRNAARGRICRGNVRGLDADNAKLLRHFRTKGVRADFSNEGL